MTTSKPRISSTRAARSERIDAGNLFWCKPHLDSCWRARFQAWRASSTIEAAAMDEITAGIQRYAADA
jgi:hypothetical protein